jgi:YhcH/YjgK/YiaL family protein
MIIDTLANAGRYFCVHPSFERAFEYIRSNNLETLAVGRNEIDGDRLWGIVAEGPGMTAAESAAGFECHNKHIDIQLCIGSVEQMGWKPRQHCIRQNGEYDEQKDVLFYKDAPDMYFELRDRQFVIFFPEDVHAPMIGEGTIRKLVVKVRI